MNLVYDQVDLYLKNDIHAKIETDARKVLGVKSHQRQDSADSSATHNASKKKKK